MPCLTIMKLRWHEQHLSVTLLLSKHCLRRALMLIKALVEMERH